MILNIVVPHLEHFPFIALRTTPPFPFMETSFASAICRFDLHFTQYPSTLAAAAAIIKHLSILLERYYLTLFTHIELISIINISIE